MCTTSVQAAQAVHDAAAGLLVGPETPLTALAGLATDLVDAPLSAERAGIAWCRLSDVEDDVLRAALAGDSLDAVEAAIVRSALAERSLGQFPVRTSAELDDVVARAATAYQTVLDANAAVVVATTQQRFLDNVTHSEASMAGRSDADKAHKRDYKTGRRALERELAKKIRFRSIRELLTGETAPVVRDLGPIWLMSPLSVSDSLPLDSELFDAVIFDEASQIPVENAIPSVFRAPEVLAVGDRMQLPPTRFFESADDDGDEEIVVDRDGFRLSVTLEADSFLSQADHALGSSLLAWHYRSRSESLIAYSNAAFYAGELATVPDRQLRSDERGDIVAVDATAAQANLAALLDRPISFHRVEFGSYRDRRNQAEADYIAELVRALLAADTGLTIGVVAFSEAQQGAIEAAFDELAALDAAFAVALAAEEERVDDGEFVGLFVKNLENVQGDERDVMIISVCYGRGEDNRMRMNFGPINQVGGERRLNVIFSRAKHHMAIVSSIAASDITNTHNEGAAHLAHFLDYAAAESRGDRRAAAAVLVGRRGRATPLTGDSAAAASELADRMRERGYDVDLAVGRSGFRLDLAVRGDGGYQLAILLEPGESASATARYIAESQVLRSFGWPIARVLLSEWWTAPENVLSRIEGALRTTG